MRANTRMSADDLMLAQVRRAQELRHMKVHPDNDSMEVIVWAVVAGITWTFCLLIWWMG